MGPVIARRSLMSLEMRCLITLPDSLSTPKSRLASCVGRNTLQTSWRSGRGRPPAHGHGHTVREGRGGSDGGADTAAAEPSVGEWRVRATEVPQPCRATRSRELARGGRMVCMHAGVVERAREGGGGENAGV